MDFHQSNSTYSHAPVEQIMVFIKENRLKIHLIMETHTHADHLTNAQVAVGEHIVKVQNIFKTIYNLGDDFHSDGSQFDKLINSNEVLEIGSLKIKMIPTPGHTPDGASYFINDVVFTGDTLFMPDFGVGRCDFPGGSAKDLYDSVKNRLYKLPDTTKVFPAHDYQPGGRKLQYETTIGKSKESNIHIHKTTTEKEFVNFRVKRDKTLSAPQLLFPSLAININAGHLPKPENNNVSYLKIPIYKKNQK